MEQVRPAESPHLRKLEALLEEDWESEPNTQTHIYIGKPSSSLAPKAKSLITETSTTAKVITAAIVAAVAIIQTLRELGLLKL